MSANHSPAEGRKRTVERYKTLLYPTLIAVPVIAVLVWLLLSLRPEALTADEILGKRNWSEQELTDALARSLAPQSNRGKRREVLNHLRKELQNYPEGKQRELRIKAMTGAVTESLRQIRALPVEEQDKMAEAIRSQAQKSFEDAQTQKGKDILEQVKTSEEGQALTAEISRVVYTELTPDERRRFAPITEIWTKTLQLPTK